MVNTRMEIGATNSKLSVRMEMGLGFCRKISTRWIVEYEGVIIEVAFVI